MVDIPARELPLWRSLLYIPVTSEKFVAKAHDRGADAIKLDLEDAVALSEKPRARTMVRQVAQQITSKGTPCLVRINRPWHMAVADIEASIWPEVCGLCLPKVEAAEHVEVIDDLVTELERERGMEIGSTVFFALIETPRGFDKAVEIAASSPRMVAISLGSEDFSAEMGMQEADPEALMPYMQIVQVAARKAGILPLGYPGSIADFSDLDRFAEGARRGRALGFEGGAAIHPAQVAALNAAFSPSAAEIEEAAAIVDAYDTALAAGDGAVSFNGKMLDVPVVERSRRVLMIRDKIAAKAR
jgi:citrate lyase subunit beta/citryl-CoA lyase